MIIWSESYDRFYDVVCYYVDEDAYYSYMKVTLFEWVYIGDVSKKVSGYFGTENL